MIHDSNSKGVVHRGQDLSQTSSLAVYCPSKQKKILKRGKQNDTRQKLSASHSYRLPDSSVAPSHRIRTGSAWESRVDMRNLASQKHRAFRAGRSC